MWKILNNSSFARLLITGYSWAILNVITKLRELWMKATNSSLFISFFLHLRYRLSEGRARTLRHEQKLDKYSYTHHSEFYEVNTRLDSEENLNILVTLIFFTFILKSIIKMLIIKKDGESGNYTSSSLIHHQREWWSNCKTWLLF